MKRHLPASLLFVLAASCGATSRAPTHGPRGLHGDSMNKRILIATTSHTLKGSTGQPTGAYLSEIAHPYDVFVRSGFDVEFASVKGGAIPLDGVENADTASAAFLAKHREDLGHSIASKDLDPSRYAAIFFAGGHGAMWDLPDDAAFAAAAATIYEHGGAVAAVCHGPAALVNIKLRSGDYLIADKAVSAFTNDEERAVGLHAVVPFLLEDRLKERGARHEGAPKWGKKVVVSERLVTGQNPASAAGVAEALVGLVRATP